MSVVIGFTGHRPTKLIGGYETYNGVVGKKYESHLMELSDFFCPVLDIFSPDYVRAGMAPGADTAVAFAAVRKGIPLIACMPYPTFSKDWSDDAQRDLEYLVKNAHQVVYTREVEPENKIGVNRALHESNINVTNGISLLISLWNFEKKGGTYNCIQYCKERNIQTVNLWALYKARFDSGFINTNSCSPI